ncbi:MAG: type VI secretion system baseplate subunit TssE [Myxococcales bacterium]
MAEVTSRERLKPSLLDRLTDHSPEQRRESIEMAAQSGSQLRESVRRDLGWLFNTVQLSSAMPQLAEYPEVSRSVLNFGIPDLAGRALSSLDPRELEKVLRATILQYEPRLLRNTVNMRVAADKTQMGQNSVVFYVEASLWSQPVPVSLYLRTELNLEDGSVRVEEVDAGAK